MSKNKTKSINRLATLLRPLPAIVPVTPQPAEPPLAAKAGFCLQSPSEESSQPAGQQPSASAQAVIAACVH